jgi:hypothetical protein
MMPYGEALQQVEQGQGQLQQQYPYTYGGGELGGSLASFLGGTKLATAGLSAGQKAVGIGTKVAAPTIVGAVQSGTAEATKPSTTLKDIGTSAAIGGGLGFGGGLLGAGIEAGATKFGEASIRKTLRQLIDADTPASKAAIDELMGPSYRSVMDIIKTKNPPPEYVAPEFGKKPLNPEKALLWKEEKDKATHEAKAKYLEDLNAYYKKEPLAKSQDINDYAKRFIKRPGDLAKFTAENADAASPYQIARSQMPKTARQVQLMSDLQGLAAGAGLGGLGYTGYGALTGDTDYAKNLTLGALGGAAARTGAVTYMLSPKLQQLGQVGLSLPTAGSVYLAPDITEVVNRKRK